MTFYLLLLHPNDLQQAEGYAVGTALMNYQINLSDIFTILAFSYFINLI